MGAGAVQTGSMDTGNLLKPLCRRADSASALPPGKTIALLEKGALARRRSLRCRAEPKGAKILIKGRSEPRGAPQRHFSEALEASVELSAVCTGATYGQAIDVLDEPALQLARQTACERIGVHDIKSTLSAMTNPSVRSAMSVRTSAPERPGLARVRAR